MTSERSIPHLRDIFGLGGQAFQSGYSEINQKNIENFDESKNKSKKSSKKSKNKDNYKTLTNGDVKTLERHLSMKKTIRKKIMRDLQQAFVEDPNEFKIENSTPEQLKAELSAEAMKFGEKHNKRNGPDSNFLDMLRGEGRPGGRAAPAPPAPAPDDYSSARPEPADEEGGAQPNSEKTSFWRRFTIKNKTKR